MKYDLFLLFVINFVTTMHQQQRQQQTMDWQKNIALIIVNPIMIINDDDPLITDDNNDDDDDNHSDYQIYLQHFDRHEKISPNISFDKLPRMNLSKDDFHRDWLKSIDWPNRNSDMETLKFQNVPIIHDKFMTSHNDDDDHQDVLLALRICALRCLFTELGIIPNNCDFVHFDESIIDKCRNDWQNFRKFYLANFLRINFDKLELYEWWNWLTPTSVGHSPRFDTIYYLVILPQTFPKISTNNGHWISPNQLSSLLLPPSDNYELKCLSQFNQIDKLKQFLKQEYSQISIQRWIPYIEFYQDGCISYLPGKLFFCDGKNHQTFFIY